MSSTLTADAMFSVANDLGITSHNNRCSVHQRGRPSPSANVAAAFNAANIALEDALTHSTTDSPDQQTTRAQHAAELKRAAHTLAARENRASWFDDFLLPNCVIASRSSTLFWRTTSSLASPESTTQHAWIPVMLTDKPDDGYAYTPDSIRQRTQAHLQLLNTPSPATAIPPSQRQRVLHHIQRHSHTTAYHDFDINLSTPSAINIINNMKHNRAVGPDMVPVDFAQAAARAEEYAQLGITPQTLNAASSPALPLTASPTDVLGSQSTTPPRCAQTPPTNHPFRLHGALVMHGL